MSVSVRRVHVVLSTLLDLRAEESRVVRHVKPPRYGEASRRPRALSRVRTQAIGALAQGSYPLSYPSAQSRVPYITFKRNYREFDIFLLSFVVSFRHRSVNTMSAILTLCTGKRLAHELQANEYAERSIDCTLSRTFVVWRIGHAASHTSRQIKATSNARPQSLNSDVEYPTIHSSDPTSKNRRQITVS